MEQGIDAVAAIRLDDTEVLGLGVLLNDVAKIFNGDARLDMGDRLLKAFASRFDEADVVRITSGLVADVVSLVEIAVVAFVEEGDVEIENVAVLKDSLIWYAVTDDLVDGCAE